MKYTLICALVLALLVALPALAEDGAGVVNAPDMPGTEITATPEPEPTPEPAPVTTPEPTPEPAPVTTPEPESTPTSQPASDTAPEASNGSSSEPIDNGAPEADATPTPAPVAAPETITDPTPEPTEPGASEPDAVDQPEAGATPTPAPTATNAPQDDPAFVPPESEQEDGGQTPTPESGYQFSIFWSDEQAGSYTSQTTYAWNTERLCYEGHEEIVREKEPAVTLRVVNTGSAEISVEATHTVRADASWSDASAQTIAAGESWSTTCRFCLSDESIHALNEGTQAIGMISVSVQ